MHDIHGRVVWLSLQAVHVHVARYTVPNWLPAISFSSVELLREREGVHACIIDGSLFRILDLIFSCGISMWRILYSENQSVLLSPLKALCSRHNALRVTCASGSTCRDLGWELQ